MKEDNLFDDDARRCQIEEQKRKYIALTEPEREAVYRRLYFKYLNKYRELTLLYETLPHFSDGSIDWSFCSNKQFWKIKNRMGKLDTLRDDLLVLRDTIDVKAMWAGYGAKNI